MLIPVIAQHFCKLAFTIFQYDQQTQTKPPQTWWPSWRSLSDVCSIPQGLLQRQVQSTLLQHSATLGARPSLFSCYCLAGCRRCNQTNKTHYERNVNKEHICERMAETLQCKLKDEIMRLGNGNTANREKAALGMRERCAQLIKTFSCPWDIAWLL